MIHQINALLFYIQEPKIIKLGKTYTWEKLSGKSRLMETNDTFQYVPILDLTILGNKALCEEVTSYFCVTSL